MNIGISDSQAHKMEELNSLSIFKGLFYAYSEKGGKNSDLNLRSASKRRRKQKITRLSYNGNLPAISMQYLDDMVKYAETIVSQYPDTEKDPAVHLVLSRYAPLTKKACETAKSYLFEIEQFIHEHNCHEVRRRCYSAPRHL